MANLYRLVVACLFALSGQFAHSAGFEYLIESFTSSTDIGVCSLWLNAVKANDGGGAFTFGPVIQGTTCVGQYSVNGEVSNRSAPVSQQADTCPSGRKRSSDGTCVVLGGPPDAADFCKGMGDVKASFKLAGKSTGSAPTTSCYMPQPPFDGADAAKGCLTTVGDSVAVPNPDGTRSWSANGIATGGVCTDPPLLANGTPTQNPAPKATENPCPSGFPGTVNGTSVCVPSVPDSGIEGTKTTSSTTTAGVKTEVTERTTCNAGVCSSTSTTRTINAAGQVTNTVVGPTTTAPIGTKCATDPGNKVCSSVGLGTSGGSGSGNGGGSGEDGPSSFGGDCAAGFKAQSDDAVINAMAEETFRQNCKVNPDTDSQTVGKAAMTANPADIGKDNPAFATKDINSGMFSQTDIIGGGGCIADKSIQIANATFLIPLSNVCQPMAYLGYIAVAASLLLAFRIVARG